MTWCNNNNLSSSSPLSIHISHKTQWHSTSTWIVSYFFYKQIVLPFKHNPTFAIRVEFEWNKKRNNYLLITIAMIRMLESKWEKGSINMNAQVWVNSRFFSYWLRSVFHQTNAAINVLIWNKLRLFFLTLALTATILVIIVATQTVKKYNFTESMGENHLPFLINWIKNRLFYLVILCFF